jgi:hypothetical protein
LPESSYPRSLALFHVVLHLLYVFAGVETGIELLAVHSQLTRLLLEIAHAEFGLVVEHAVVERPELPLLVRAERRLRRL